MSLLCGGMDASAQKDSVMARALSVQSGSDDCMDEAALRSRVQRWLDADSLRTDLQVVVHAREEPLSFTLRRDGEVVAVRRFDVLPNRCADRLDAVALAIAVALEQATPRTSDSGLGAEQAKGTPIVKEGTAAATLPSPVALDGTEKVAAPVPRSAPETAAAPEARAGEPAAAEAGPLRVYAAGSVLVGTLPEPAVGLGVGAELELDALSLGAGALVSVETDSVLSGGQAQARLFAARTYGCLGQNALDLWLDGCAGIAAGVVAAEGRGYPEQKMATVAWLAPLLRVTARYPRWGVVSVRFALDGLWNAVRPRLQVRGAGGSDDGADPFGAAASLELLIALP